MNSGLKLAEYELAVTAFTERRFDGLGSMAI